MVRHDTVKNNRNIFVPHPSIIAESARLQMLCSPEISLSVPSNSHNRSMQLQIDIGSVSITRAGDCGNDKLGMRWTS